jgi:lysyl-tRNA synthetase, class II
MSKKEVKPISEADYAISRKDELTKLGYVYPSGFKTTKTLSEYRMHYTANYEIKTGERLKDLSESIAGRVKEKRIAGKKLCFYTICCGNVELQLLMDEREWESKTEFRKTNKLIKRGDIVGAIGFPGQSNRDELSLYPTELYLLSPCFKYTPREHFGVKDPETRARKRYLDLLANKKSRDVFNLRSNVMSFIRTFLNNDGFIEVQTPILSFHAGGATAKPFTTFHNDLGKEMYMRIAPELFLKKLVVGGMEKVYEIGPQFRNESMDLTHNPEFWSLEFYQAYADYLNLMDMSQVMLTKLISALFGKFEFEYTIPHSDKTIMIDLSPPFQRIDIPSKLEEFGIKFPETLDDMKTEIYRGYLETFCDEHEITCPEPKTVARLLDRLIGHYIEPLCVNPTFLIHHPSVLCSLAKCKDGDKRFTQRFELFVAGVEIANAYSELNDPVEQELRFKEQLKDKAKGDMEIPSIDKDFIEALEYGLPPTGGFGLGIDRLVMLLSNTQSIKDVILFPPMVPDDCSSVHPSIPPSSISPPEIPPLKLMKKE